mmetsp:Transcript_2477/g.7544  ORF Transcript_2477/g.7544 Transcript_2477/m.7544 type:complete len:200 (+) Transcript_2477:357-956(+)
MSLLAALSPRFEAGDLASWDPARKYETFWYDLWLDEPRVGAAVEVSLAAIAERLLAGAPRPVTDRLYVLGAGRLGFDHFHRDFSAAMGEMLQLWVPLEEEVGAATGGGLELLGRPAAEALERAAEGPCQGLLGEAKRDLGRGSACEREAAAAAAVETMRLGDVLVKLPDVWHRAAPLGALSRRAAYTVSFVPRVEEAEE